MQYQDKQVVGYKLDLTKDELPIENLPTFQPSVPGQEGDIESVKKYLMRVLDQIFIRYESKITLNPYLHDQNHYEMDLRIEAGKTFTKVRQEFCDLGFVSGENVTELVGFFEQQVQDFIRDRKSVAQKLYYAKEDPR